MDHMCTVNSSQGLKKVFLPIDSVLKDEHNSPSAANTRGMEAAAKREEQKRSLDVDLGKISVDEQKRLYEEALRANYQIVSRPLSQPVSQLPYSQFGPAAQMGYIIRAREGGNHPHCNRATSQPYDHSSRKSHDPHRRLSHQYDEIPGPDLYNQQHQQYDEIPGPKFYNQQHQQYPASNQTNPYNLEVGSLIQYGNPPLSGTIKWLGCIPEIQGLSAGVEMVRLFVYQFNPDIQPPLYRSGVSG